MLIKNNTGTPETIKTAAAQRVQNDWWCFFPVHLNACSLTEKWLSPKCLMKMCYLHYDSGSTHLIAFGSNNEKSKVDCVQQIFVQTVQNT